MPETPEDMYVVGTIEDRVNRIKSGLEKRFGHQSPNWPTEENLSAREDACFEAGVAYTEAKHRQFAREAVDERMKSLEEVRADERAITEALVAAASRTISDLVLLSSKAPNKAVILDALAPLVKAAVTVEERRDAG